jgi:hypothetical protein
VLGDGVVVSGKLGYRGSAKSQISGNREAAGP